MLEAFLPPPILELFFGPDIFVAPSTIPMNDDDDEQDSNIDDDAPSMNGNGGDSNGQHQQPQHASAAIGDNDDPTFRHSRMTRLRIWQTAVQHRRRHPVMYLYVVSTNPRNELGIEYLLQDAPVLMWRLANSDFFSPEQGCYPTLGVDRAATALAAASITGVPALVVDGGTAMTYTAVNMNGKLLGGGITPGINLKLRSLADGTGALPYVQVPHVLERIQQCQQSKKPLPFASNNTPDAILSAVLRETTSFSCSVIEAWKSHAQNEMQMLTNEPTETANEGENDATAMDVDHDAAGSDAARHAPATSTTTPRLAINRKMRFMVTGGDGPLLRSLLSPRHSYILEPLPGFPPQGYSGSVALTPHPHLVHYGIGHVLRRQHQLLARAAEDSSAVNSTEAAAVEKDRRDLLGLRVVRCTEHAPVRWIGISTASCTMTIPPNSSRWWNCTVRRRCRGT
jgi:pantothenate kinase type III